MSHTLSWYSTEPCLNPVITYLLYIAVHYPTVPGNANWFPGRVNIIQPCQKTGCPVHHHVLKMPIEDIGTKYLKIFT